MVSLESLLAGEDFSLCNANSCKEARILSTEVNSIATDTPFLYRFCVAVNHPLTPTKLTPRTIVAEGYSPFIQFSWWSLLEFAQKRMSDSL